MIFTFHYLLAIYPHLFTAQVGYVLTKQELRVLRNLLAAYSDEKLKEIRDSITHEPDQIIMLENIQRIMRENGLVSMADTLKLDLEKGQCHIRVAVFVRLTYISRVQCRFNIFSQAFQEAHKFYL